MNMLELNSKLLAACFQGKLDVAKRLVDKGADINALDSYGDSPLMEAAWEGHLKVVKYLVSRGAKLGKGKLYYANCPKNCEIQKLLQQNN